MALRALDSAGSRRFELLRHLGSGGMGSVFEALDRERGARIALKTLQSADADALLYLKNEFRALADVRHENLVQLLELVEEDGRFFVAMELVEGSELLPYVRPGDNENSLSGVTETRLVEHRAGESSSRLESPTAAAAPSGQGFDEARLRASLKQLALGLSALHERGKVHRDVKPSNVLVARDGRVVLVDFGLATESALGGAGADSRGLGTRAFMAPEQAAGQRVTGAADWYSFGVVLYLALTGSLPFRGPELERLKLAAAPRPIGELAPAAPADLAALALELLDPDPARRPPASVVLERLGGAAPRAAPHSPFLGRDRELGELSAAFAAARSRAVMVLVSGDSGLGKSALSRELSRQLASTDALVLAGRCYERELVPYKAFDGIIDSLSHSLRALPEHEAERLIPPNAGLLARIFPVLERVPALARDAVQGTEDLPGLRAAAFAALRELFARLAQERPVLLYIDDLQWADADSHALLVDLLRPPSAPRICLLATTRPQASSLPALRAQLGADLRELVLSPLSRDDTERLATSALGDADHPELARAIAAEAAGHPLFVQTLAEHARRTGRLELVPLRLEDALWARIEGIGSRARGLLELVTVAGAPLPTPTARHGSRLDGASFAADMASLHVARLVRTTTDGEAHERVEPYHDRIRETVLSHLPGAVKRTHHAQLAEAMQATGRAAQDPQGLVQHLEGAERLQEAADHAERLAQRAAHALAFDQASELYATALRLGEFSAPRRRELTLLCATALTNAGRAVEAARAYQQVAQGADPEQRVEFRRLAADHLLRSGHLEEGTAILSAVLSEQGEDLRSQRRSLVRTVVERARLSWRGLAWSPVPPESVPSQVRRRIDAYHAVGISLALIDPFRGAAFEARAVRLALDAGDPRLVATTLVMEAGYEGSTGARGIARAGRLLVEIDRAVALIDDRYSHAIRDMIQGFLDYHSGEFERAVPVLARLEHTFAELRGAYFERQFCHCFRLICLRHCGRWHDLQAGFEAWVRDAERRGDRFTEASLRFNLNGVWLMRDAPEEALRDLSRVSWIPPASGYHMQHWYEQQARAEIALYAGDVQAGLARFREQVQALSRSFLFRMRLHRCQAQWILGRLILANHGGALSRALRRELRSLALRLSAEDLGCAKVWSLLLTSALQHQQGDAAAACVTLQAARQLAHAHQLTHLEHAASFRWRELATDPVAAAAGELADGWATAQGIVRPARAFNSWAPGFGDSAANAGGQAPT